MYSWCWKYSAIIPLQMSRASWQISALRTASGIGPCCCQHLDLWKLWQVTYHNDLADLCKLKWIKYPLILSMALTTNTHHETGMKLFTNNVAVHAWHITFFKVKLTIKGRVSYPEGRDTGGRETLTRGLQAIWDEIKSPFNAGRENHHNITAII